MSKHYQYQYSILLERLNNLSAACSMAGDSNSDYWSWHWNHLYYLVSNKETNLNRHRTGGKPQWQTRSS